MNVPQSPDFGIIGLAISSAPAVPTDPQGAVNAPDDSAGHGANPNQDGGQGEHRERCSSKKEPDERPSPDAGNVAPGKAPHAETSIPPYRQILSATEAPFCSDSVVVALVPHQLWARLPGPFPFILEFSY